MPLHGIVLVLIVYGVGLGVLLLVLMGLSSSGLFSDTSGYVGVTLIPLVLGIAVGAAWMQKRAGSRSMFGIRAKTGHSDDRPEK